MPFETVHNVSNYDWKHSYSAQFPDPFGSSQYSLSLSFTRIWNGQATSIIRNFRSIIFNTTIPVLLCWLYFECCVVCILKSHCNLLVVDVTHEVVLFFIPVITQLPHRSHWTTCATLSRLQYRYCLWESFLNSDTIWLIVLSVSPHILYFADTFCLPN